MSRVEVFLDDTPGESRGVVVRDGQYERLIIQRDDDAPAHRLGARSVGRILRVEAGLKGAFVDVGEGAPAFLPGARTPPEGSRIEVEVTAEPRESKGAVVRLIGPGAGEPRLCGPGPDVRAILAELAPGVEPQGGVEAIRAALSAEEEALSDRMAVETLGLDLGIERTRAMIAVDLDLAPGAATGRNARDRANARGLLEAARLIRLRQWGGLVAVDLIGTGHDGEAVLAVARRAFGDAAAYGPVNRFGVLMISLPWGRRPVDDLLRPTGEAARTRLAAQTAVRRLRLALLSDRSQPTMTLCCSPEVGKRAEPWIEALGPRARLKVAPEGPALEYELWTR